MAVEQSDAIVLRVIPWSETSLIAHIYTRDFGKLSVLAKGARRPKSPFEAALDLLSICRVVFISKSSDALDLLTEAKLTRRFRGGSRDLLRLYAGYYVAELLERLTDKQDRQPEIFELAEDTLTAISGGSGIALGVTDVAVGGTPAQPATVRPLRTAGGRLPMVGLWNHGQRRAVRQLPSGTATIDSCA